MKYVFNIPYTTHFGQSVRLHVRAAGAAEEQSYAMTTVDGNTWTCQVDTGRYNGALSLDYRFSIVRDGHEERREWPVIVHRLEQNNARAEVIEAFCRWSDMPCDTYLYSSAFTGCINRRPATPLPTCGFARTLRLVVRAPQLRAGQRLAVVGRNRQLGEWKPSRAVAMYEHNYNEWVADIDVSEFGSSRAELKFIAVGRTSELFWETCDNRVVDVPRLADGEMAVVELDQAFFELYDEKVAGTLIPVFSLRSEGSFGVGDFGDLKLMADWVASTGQRVLQILPVNDTTATHTRADSYPYSCISVFALHPLYADLRQLPRIADKDAAARMEALRQELNALPQVDYERVSKAKDEYLHIVFDEGGHRELKTDSFARFFRRAARWLVPYAQYCLLRDTYGTPVFDSWPDHRQWDEADRKALSSPSSAQWRDVAFFYYVQYVLDRQLRAAHDHACSRGVVLKGDIPIGVNRYGCDVWHEPQYFNTDTQAGAPPDAFAVNGQNWEFPTYNWRRMLDDGCGWWLRRFSNMALFFDAYRIDHVLGFFRIWAIPGNCVHALSGQFMPSLGMTRAEIEAYGIHFREDFFTRPYIARWVVDRLFGADADRISATYLRHDHDDAYSLRPEYDSERKIEKAFRGMDSCLDNQTRDSLYALCSDVLFVRDHDNPQLFHPRITAHHSFVYQTLTDADKSGFNNLYNDYFYRRNNDFWYGEAMKKLPVLVQATRMLACAEDLGMVPECVAWVMERLRVLSLELQSMPKDPGVRFGHLSRNPYRSVCTLSTHDMPTLRQWWDEDRERTQDFYSSMLFRRGAAPHPLPGWLARDIVSRQLTSPSMLCILSLQDWLAVSERLRLPDANAERINVPSDPHHYWRYRMHLTIEQLLADKEFTSTVKELIDGCGRRL